MKHTRFTAGLMALSIATATMAAPARASDDDVALALGGLLTLFVVGKMINDASESKPAQERVRETYREPPRAERKPLYSPFDIPSSCIVTVDRRQGPDTQIAIDSCLKKERRAKAPLPKRCEVDVRARNGSVDGYDMTCLNRFGYQVAGRGRH